MPQPVTKPKKLWGSPNVFISPTHLMVEERYYALDQTRGAYVEPVAEEGLKAESKAAQTQPSTDTRSGFRKTLSIVGGIFIVLVVVVFIAWWNDGNDTYGTSKSSKMYQLVLISEFGPVVVLRHSKEKKLREIASHLNQAPL